MYKKVEERNKLESYINNLDQTVNDEKLKDKIPQEDRDIIENLVKETKTWLEGNTDASLEDLESKYKEVEKSVMPIMTKLYGAGGTPPAGEGGMPGMPNMPGMPDLSKMKPEQLQELLKNMQANKQAGPSNENDEADNLDEESDKKPAPKSSPKVEEVD